MKIKELTIKNLKSGKFIKELPEFYELKNIIENNSWHKNESTFNHTLNVLDNYLRFLNKNKNNNLRKYLGQKIDNYKRKDLLHLAIVLHDIGKVETIVKNGKKSSFPKHEIISVLKSRKILKRFNLSSNEASIILGTIKNHSKEHDIVDISNNNLKIQFNDIIKNISTYVIELTILVMMDTLNSYLKETAPNRYKFKINFYKKVLVLLSKTK